MSHDEAIFELYRALNSPHGVVLKSLGDAADARQRLYSIKVKSKDPQLQSLVIRLSPENEDELWILKAESLPKLRGRKPKELKIEDLL